MKNKLIKILNQPTSAAPLAVFRLLFGILMMVSMVRFAANGWIQKLYVEPTFFFSYSGFEWVKPMGQYTWILFFICGLSALFVTLGYKYRWAIFTFFLSFTYIELMDKTTYLNHYYFISVLSFMMIFLPMQARFSIDALIKSRANIFSEKMTQVPRWTILSIMGLLSVVYLYAGLAKLNTDWLVHAMPLKIWLPTKAHIPVIGPMMEWSITPFLFSWGGAAYDLLIPFLLFFSRTRKFAFIAVILFHLLTGFLFPIGMFPYIMIGASLIFLSASTHEKILLYLNVLGSKFGKIFRLSQRQNPTPTVEIIQGAAQQKNSFWNMLAPKVVGFFLIIQLLFPLRSHLHSGDIFWTENGYRFSWRVMLMEKAGYATFKIVDPQTNQKVVVNNSDFLSTFQEKQMSTQPDFILEYARYLEEHFINQGMVDPAIFVESYVALNGRRSQPYINPKIDLTETNTPLFNNELIEPFGDEISGF